jgi:hypothetical protein
MLALNLVKKYKDPKNLNPALLPLLDLILNTVDTKGNHTYLQTFPRAVERFLVSINKWYENGKEKLPIYLSGDLGVDKEMYSIIADMYQKIVNNNE